MKMRETVIVWVCDACGSESIERKGGDPALGIHIDFFWHHEMGGSGGKVFACSGKCIVEAIENYGRRD